MTLIVKEFATSPVGILRRNATCKKCIKKMRIERVGPTPEDLACSKCKKRLLAKEFYDSKVSPTGKLSVCKRCHRSAIYLRSYGITADRYDEMLAAQGGRCGVCGSDKSGGMGLFHVDHDHATGQVRSLLCSMCNVGLGSFRDDVSILSKAIEYLTAHSNGGIIGGQVQT